MRYIIITYTTPDLIFVTTKFKTDIIHFLMLMLLPLFRWTGNISGSVHSLPGRQAAPSLPGTFISVDSYATFAAFPRRLSPPSSSRRFYDSKRRRFCHGAAPHVNIHHRHHCHSILLYFISTGRSTLLERSTSLPIFLNLHPYRFRRQVPKRCFITLPLCSVPP